MKYQDENQEKGRWGELLAAFAFPPHWVVRPLSHDYGIDLQVEIFVPDSASTSTSTSRRRYRSTGGHFSCQVKTTDLGVRGEGSFNFSIDTADLKLSESMGTAAPLVILVVNRPTRLIYYLCLTDYVAKVLDNENPNWRAQDSATIQIPTRNVLDVGSDGDQSKHWQYFRGLGYRSKLYSVIAAFNESFRELERSYDSLIERASNSADEFNAASKAFDATLRAAIKVAAAPSLTDLADLDSPYAGLFENASIARRNLESTYDAAWTRAFAETPARSDYLRLETEQSYLLAASKAVFLYRWFVTIGSIYEETHRLAGLSPLPVPYDIGG